MPDIELPYKYKPRSYQIPIWKYMESGGKRAVCLWHRRAGKDLTAINILGVQAFKRKGTYWHLFPTYAKGRKVAWDGMTSSGDRFLDTFPSELIESVDNSTMKIYLKNGSIYQIIGSDDIDQVVGTNPIGIISSEYSVGNPKAWDLIRPILAENGGWIIFIYTARGRNHGYDLYEMAKKNPNWFCEKLTIDDTKAINIDAVNEDRESGMPEEMIQQEYYCSFDAALTGGYYKQGMQKIIDEKRICFIPAEPYLPVHTFWDLGMDDETTIWFMQEFRNELRFIDYYHNNGEGLAHYAKVLQKKDYIYGEHWAPHDIKVRELGTGKSRLEVAKRQLGLHFRVAKRLDIEDGIEAVRGMLPFCWFDEVKCQDGIRALSEYTKEYDDTKKIYKTTPLHNWASHGADAFRTFATSWKPRTRRTEKSNKIIHAKTDYDIFR